MPLFSRVLFGAVALVALIGAMAPATSAAAVRTYLDPVDITFPTSPGVTYVDSYHSSRSGGRVHKATDMMGQKGSPIYAARGGEITFIPGTAGEAQPSYGWMIRIAGTDGRTYAYVHLNNDTPGTDNGAGGPGHAYAPGLRRGSLVSRGQLIGYMGDSGNAENAGAHLHFEIEDPAVTDPYGTHKVNPHASLEAARHRGDYAGAHVGSTVTARTILRACPAGSVPTAGFVDFVDATHLPAVNCVVWWDIAHGTTAHTFDAVDLATRGQMATFVARLIEAGGGALPAAPADHFTDDNGSPHELAINRLAEAGVVGGVGGGRFAPGAVVSRGQMATFLMRAYERVVGSALAAAADAFADDTGNIHEPRINQAAARGIAAGFPTGGYEPDLPFTRGQMASFVARMLDLMVEQGHAELPTA